MNSQRLFITVKAKIGIFSLFMMLFAGVVPSFAQETWYTLADGDWDNYQVWTLDPAGAVRVNPTSDYPRMGDNVIILSGKKVTIPDNVTPYSRTVAVVCASITVNGELDLRSSAGHTIGAFKGSGRIYTNSGAVPVSGVSWSHFVTAGQGQGTIVLNGTGATSATLPSSLYNLEVALTSGIAVLNQSIELNGNLKIASGTLQVNGAGTTAHTLTVRKDITVSIGASFTVGSGNVVNILNAYGDFKNYGTVDFANSAQYASIGGGELKVYFRGETDNVLLCNGTTDFYRLILAKGSDDTYKLTVSADLTSRFKLFGPVTTVSRTVESVNEDGVGQILGYEKLPLLLLAGTLKLESNIVIPTLGEDMVGENVPNEFCIPYGTKLWINGASVSSATGGGGNRGTRLEGTLQVSAGSFTNPDGTGGIQYKGNGSKPGALVLEGTGVVNTTELKEGDSTGRFIYRQSGGTLNLTGVADWTNISAIMALPQSDYVFEMTGGTINIDAVNATQKSAGPPIVDNVSGIYIRVDEGNYNVTGGIINIITPTRYKSTINDFEIYSTAPFYDLNIVNEATRSGTQKVLLNSGLTVLNDFVIGASTSFDAGTYNVEIGGDLTNNGTFTANGNTTKFIGAGASTVNGGTIAFAKLELDKDVETQTVTLGMGTISVSGNLTLTSGTLGVGTVNRNVGGNVEIIAGAITGASALVLNGTAQQSLKGKVGKEQSFGNIVFANENNDLSLLSDVNVGNFTFSSIKKVSIGFHNLTISGTLSGFSSSKYFYTNGLASDRGLTLYFSIPANYAGGTLATYPIGTSSKYSPAYVKAGTGQTVYTDGYFTVIPVSGEHPATYEVALTDVLPYYWKTKVTGFDNLTDGVVNLEFDYSSYIPKDMKVSYLDGVEWVRGGAKYKNNESSILYFNNTKVYDYFKRLINGDFTAGKDNGLGQSPFGRVDVFYSRQDANWYDTYTSGSKTYSAAWVDENENPVEITWWGTVGFPGKGDIVRIRNNHRIYLPQNSTNIEIGMLEFVPATGVTDREQLPRLEIFTRNNLILNRIKGVGVFSQHLNNTNNPVITGDFGEFSDETYSWFLFKSDVSAEVELPDDIFIYPNVMTETNDYGNNYYSSFKFPVDVVIKRNLNPRGKSILRLNDGAKGDIAVGGDLVIGDWLDGVVEFPASGVKRTLTIDGNIDFTSSYTAPTNARAIRLTSETTSLLHDLIVKGDVKQGEGVIDLAGTNGGVNVVFNGNASSTVSKTGAGATEFYSMVIEKTVGQKVHITGDFDLKGATNTATKALTLTSGECHLDNDAIEIMLTSGGGNFKIPSGTTLRVDNGSEVVMSGSGTGIWLDGNLILANSLSLPSGGELNCDGDNNGIDDGTNYIEYSASGSATINVGTGSKLSLGAQLRRSTTTDAGILHFTQSAGSTVLLGTVGAPTVNRSVFEVLGSSTLTQAAGANITLVSPQTSATVPALMIDTDAAPSLGAGSSFTIGTASPTGQTFDIYSSSPLENLNVVGNTAQLKTGALTLNGSLDIATGSTFHANGYDLTLKGNLAYSGTFTPAGNTTYFSGTADQIISGAGATPAFYNLVKQGTNTLSLTCTNDVAVNGNLTIAGGILNIGSRDLTVLGNVNNVGTVQSTSTNGVLFKGTATQVLSGNGTFAIMTIDNANGVNVPTQSGAITFNNALRMKNGVMDIGQNLLHFGVGASIVPVNDFSTTNMVQTNLSFIDNGIRKVFPAGASTFTYPIGSLGKYTPIELTVTGNGNNTGSIRVKAADEHHVSVVDLAETLYDETQNVLQYNWTLDATGMTGFSAKCVMQGYPSDALITNAGGSTFTLSDYITARILLSSTEWNKFDEDLKYYYDEGTGKLNFDFSNTNDAGIDGDYTAGVKSCIPDRVATYITVANDGNWNEKLTWATYNPTLGIPAGVGEAGVNVPDGGIKGAVVYIDRTVNIPAAESASAYRTYLLTDGVLNVGTSIANRLGDVYGTGTLKLQNSAIPAGVYTSFFAAGGGTMEFVAGATPYTFMGDKPEVNNMKLSGSGTLQFSNTPLTINGNLIFNGASVTNPNNNNFSVAGNVTFNSGSFDAGTSTVTLNGAARQTIGGTNHFTSGNAFYNLVVNNSSGIDISNGLGVSNTLTMTSGILGCQPTGWVEINNSSNTAISGAGAGKYVSGPLKWNVTTTNEYMFPVGKDGRYGELTLSGASGAGLWEIEYYSTAPVDRSNMSGVQFVSNNEYWRLQTFTSRTAIAKLRWDANSGVDPNANFRVVDSDGADSSDPWSLVSYTDLTGTTSGGSCSTVSLTYNTRKRLTFGSATKPNYIWEGTTSVDWTVAGNWSNGVLPLATSNVIIENQANDPEILGGKDVTVNAISMSPGAKLTLKPSAHMTVNGDIVNNSATILVQSTAVGSVAPASFLTNGTVSAPVSIEWTYPLGAYIYIGHGVDNALKTNYGSALLYRIVNGGWVAVGTSPNAFNTSPLEGYAVGFPSSLGTAQTITNTGALHDSNYSMTIGNNWYLVANPYPTYLDLANSGLMLGDALKTIYTTIRGAGTASYATFNILTDVGVNEANRYVAPGQSFWIRNYTASSSLSINKTVRTNNSNSLLKSLNTTDDVFRIKLIRSSV
ncbi:hypothetical protein LX69_01585, partial [Breznakibacter xylanolyticus]